jgi:hypothetical protein
VKKRRVYTIAWIILGSALLFNQVGLGFFHDSHKAHKFFEASQKSKTLLLEHNEHCEVCSLQVLFHVVLPAATEVPAQIFVTEYSVKGSHEPVLIFCALAFGRGPPTIA